MQPQVAEAFCLQVRIGRIGLVSMPADYVPRRIDWAKWVDCVSSGAGIFNSQVGTMPRVCLSPDHQDPKDNMSVISLQEQRGLEFVDLLRMFSEIAEGTRFLFAGSWSPVVPSWVNSSQAVFGAKYGVLMPDVLSKQLSLWSPRAERLEKQGLFLVTDDVGRLSALSSLSKSWRTRQNRSGVLTEPRSLSWFAASLDVHMGMSSEGVPARLHRLAILEPEHWCGAPRIKEEFLRDMRIPTDCQEIWISSPALGLSLWIADQQESLKTSMDKLRMPSSVLGWHPLRDLVAFLAEAPPRSVLYMVDRQSRLQLLLKEQDAPA